ncbi:MAG: electron transport complex subunit RsxC [Verrucomicrobiota bacterium]
MKILRELFRSKGGIHPASRKRATAAMPVENMPLSKVFFVSMVQHMGAPARPIVKKGDAVMRGQVLGEAGGYVSAPVHAPTSGKVIALGERPTQAGLPAVCVEIETDGADRWDPAIQPGPDWKTMEPKVLVERIVTAGIVGMGGAGFPTHVKLLPPAGKTIDTLIINGAECEPYLTADLRLMVEMPQSVWTGAQIVRQILGARRIVMAIEDNKPDAIQAMRAVMQATDAELVVLKTKYPQGAEKQLIYAVTGREVPSGGLPMAVGALVENVGTCAAIYETITAGRPLTERIVTVTGAMIRTPKNLRVRIGAPLSDLAAFCGGMAGQPGKIVCGGPMMGLAQGSLETAVTKTTSGVVLLPRQAVQQFSSMPCISCGRCVSACPMRLMPNTLGEMIEADDIEGAEGLDVMDCIECGACAYECPAHRPLVQHMRRAKAEIAKQRREKETANKG